MLFCAVSDVVHDPLSASQTEVFGVTVRQTSLRNELVLLELVEEKWGQHKAG